MANTYTQIHLHIVFAVQGRHAAIPEAHAERLYRYITGIVTERDQKLLAINGIVLRNYPTLSDTSRGQQAHHRKQTFQEEYRSILDRFGIDYDPRYVFGAD